jgi:HK97 family phage prohead protease
MGVPVADSAENRELISDYELRGADTTEPTVEGYAATFNQPYPVGKLFTEQIDPGAFKRSLNSPAEVKFLVDHEGPVLASKRSGTLTLTADTTGLHSVATLDPANPNAAALISALRRKDYDKMSFAFTVPSGGDGWDQDLRTIRSANLMDVSVVAYPANENTTVALRSMDDHEAQMCFADAMFREIRSGKTISAANMAKLTDVLAAHIGTDADDTLSETLGVATEPTSVPVVQTNRLTLDMARRMAAALDL